MQLISRVWSPFLIWEVNGLYLSYLRIFEELSKAGRTMFKDTHFLGQCIPFESNPCPFDYQHCALLVVLYRNKWLSLSFIRSRHKVGVEHRDSIRVNPETDRVKENNPKRIKPQISCLLCECLFTEILGHIRSCVKTEQRKKDKEKRNQRLVQKILLLIKYLLILRFRSSDDKRQLSPDILKVESHDVCS